MMSSVPLETCWAFNKFWNNNFYYKFATCWLFLLIHITMHGSMNIKFKICLNISTQHTLKTHGYLHFVCIITLKCIPIFRGRLFCSFGSDLTYKCQSQKIYLPILWRTCYVTPSTVQPSPPDIERNSDSMTSLFIIFSSVHLYSKWRFPVRPTGRVYRKWCHAQKGTFRVL